MMQYPHDISEQKIISYHLEIQHNNIFLTFEKAENLTMDCTMPESLQVKKNMNFQMLPPIHTIQHYLEFKCSVGSKQQKRLEI